MSKTKASNVKSPVPIVSKDCDFGVTVAPHNAEPAGDTWKDREYFGDEKGTIPLSKKEILQLPEESKGVLRFAFSTTFEA